MNDKKYYSYDTASAFRKNAYDSFKPANKRKKISQPQELLQTTAFAAGINKEMKFRETPYGVHVKLGKKSLYININDNTKNLHQIRQSKTGQYVLDVRSKDTKLYSLLVDRLGKFVEKKGAQPSMTTGKKFKSKLLPKNHHGGVRGVRISKSEIDSFGLPKFTFISSNIKSTSGYSKNSRKNVGELLKR